MKLEAFSILISRRIKEKWLRFILASGGIAVGIWTITIIVSIANGINFGINQSLNAQYAFKQAEIYTTKSPNSIFNSSESDNPYTFRTLDEVKKTLDLSKVSDIVPIISYSIATAAPDYNINQCFVIQPNQLDQVNPNVKPVTPTTPTPSDKPCDSKDIDVIESNITGTWGSYYNAHKKNWHGKTEKPSVGEIVVNINNESSIFKYLGIKSDVNKDAIIGKDLQVAIKSTPSYLNRTGKVGEVFSIKDLDKIVENKTVVKTYKIVAYVIDNGSFNLDRSVSQNYINTSEIETAVKESLKKDNLGFSSFSVDFKDVNNLISSIENAKDKDNFFLLSQALETTKVLQTVIKIVSYILASFGVIALIASIFGIIGIMTMSVLERQKEIGILKALGARNRDILILFVLESSIIGFIGFVIGICITLLMNLGIYNLSKILLNLDMFKEIKTQLESYTITSFNPSLEVNVILIAFVISQVFAILSGLAPSMSAANKNPVDCLRIE
jgi:ABC-type antimicrobial peptide transport system permease subunit